MQIIAVPKISKYEFDLRRYGLSHEELVERYRKEGQDIARILTSHERHVDSVKRLGGLVSGVIHRDQLKRKTIRNVDLIIAIGGDDHFKYVSHFIDNELLMGINSDPVTSEGALNYFTIEGISKVIERIKQGDFETEEWTRLEAIINSRAVEPATAEYFLGELERPAMSHYVLYHRDKFHRDKVEEQKCSGLLVVTGAGSSGWYDSACRYLYESGNRFPKTANFARFLATEPHRGRLSGYNMAEGIIEEGEELIIKSLSKGKAVISPDCLERHNFERGKVAVVRISDKPLRVVRIQPNPHKQDLPVSV